MVKNLPVNVGNARDMDSIPRSGRSPGKGNGNPLQYSCLENSMARGGSVQCSRSVVSDCLRPREPQHTRPPCPPPTPSIHPNPCPLNRRCHHTISSSVVPFSSCPIFPSIRVFSNESALRIRWPKYWSFSFNISPSNEHPGLISFRRDWLDLLAEQRALIVIS